VVATSSNLTAQVAQSLVQMANATEVLARALMDSAAMLFKASQERGLRTQQMGSQPTATTCVGNYDAQVRTGPTIARPTLVLNITHVLWLVFS
jgi:hypothetical protein